MTTRLSEVVLVSNNCRVQLGWKASESTWDRFLREVEKEWGGTSPYAGIQIEESWREFKQAEEKHALEAVVDRIAEAAGTASEIAEEKNLARSPCGESTKVWVRVHEDVKEEMSKYAKECNVPKHAVLRGVVNWYLGGGIEQSVIDTLTDVVEDIEEAFASLADDGSITQTQKTTAAIAARLGPAFSENDLADAIDAETSGTEYYHEEYTPRVIEKKGVKRWENDDKPDMFLPPDRWQKKRTGELIEELRGDPLEDTAPPFTKEEFVRAADRAGFDVTEENAEGLYMYRERVLERLGFIWNPRSETFEPDSDDTDGMIDLDVTSYAAPQAPNIGWNNADAGDPAQGAADDD